MIDLSSPLRRIEEAAADDRVSHIKKMLEENKGTYKSTPGDPLTSYATMEPILRELLAQAWADGLEAAYAHQEALLGPPGPNGPSDPPTNPYEAP